jgi:adenylate cyclase
MPLEIERKFLVANDEWRNGVMGVRMAQAYLAAQAGRTVRIRIADENAWITIKGKAQGITRSEFEYAIPTNEAHELLELCLPSVINKTRYEIRHGAHIWEVDVFHGDNDGLVIAEVELESESERIEKPAWLGKEVSGDYRYFNSSLARHPFSQWADVAGPI